MQSRLSLSTKLNKQGKTTLDHCFFTPPFKILSLPTIHPADNRLTVIQMSSSPGILANDDLQIDLNLQANSRLRLQTQAFSRIQAMNEGEKASQHTQIQLAEDSQLVYLPHPLVLHKESAFEQQTQIELAHNSSLLYGEIIAIGRTLNDERFAFRQFSSLLTITYQNRPLLIDRIQWHPNKMSLTALSQMEHFTHQASLIYIHTGQSTAYFKQKVAELQQYQPPADMLLGISQLNEYGLIIRILALSAEQIEQCFKQLEVQLNTD